MTPGQTCSAPDPSLQRTFRDAMASLAATACVVTGGTGKARRGRTVTAVLSLSVDPPTVLVSIAAGSELATLIDREGGFSLAMLAERQDRVADAFAGKLPPERRFELGDWRAWASGRPRLAGAVAAMDCAVSETMEVGGHVLFAGETQEIDLDYARNPLVWHHRQYNSLHPLQAIAAPGD